MNEGRTIESRPRLVVAGNNCYASRTDTREPRLNELDELMLRQFLDAWPGGAELLTSDTRVSRSRQRPLPTSWSASELAGRRVAAGPLRILALPLALRRMAIAVRRADMTYARLPSPFGYWMLVVSWLCRRPIFVSLHGSPRFVANGGGGSRARAATASVVVTYLLRRANWVFSTTYALRGEYGAPLERTSYYRSTTLQGVTAAPLTSRTPSPPWRLGFVGRLSEEKNPQLFLDVLHGLRSSGAPVEGVIVGAGPLLDPLRDRVEDLGLSNVTFLGWVDDPAEVRRHIQSMDLLLVTSRHEGSPKILLEGMAYGTPSVTAVRNDVIEDYAKHGGVVLVDTSDPDDWVSAINRIMKPGDYEERVDAGVQYAAGLTLENLSREVSSILQAQRLFELNADR